MIRINEGQKLRILSSEQPIYVEFSGELENQLEKCNIFIRKYFFECFIDLGINKKTRFLNLIKNQ